jgi:hypothetical protein
MLAAMPDLVDVDVRTLERFLATWYGPPDRPAAGRPGAAAPRSLPRPLREWYIATSRYSRPLTFHNTVLEPDQVQEDGGKLVFWVENQEVVLWAADRDGDDPMVYERVNVDGAPWHPTGVPLSGFLLNVAILEACMGGASCTAHAAGLNEAQTTDCLAPLRPMPYLGPTYRGQLYVGRQMLAFATWSPGDLWELYLAARTSTAIEQLITGTTGISWDVGSLDS